MSAIFFFHIISLQENNFRKIQLVLHRRFSEFHVPVIISIIATNKNPEIYMNFVYPMFAKNPSILVSTDIS